MRVKLSALPLFFISLLLRCVMTSYCGVELSNAERRNSVLSSTVVLTSQLTTGSCCWCIVSWLVVRYRYVLSVEFEVFMLHILYCVV